jgi:aspartyl protease family protein
MTRRFAAILLSAWLGGHCAIALALAQIEVQALMQGAAILRIDGAQRMLRSGERSPEGVLLIDADPRRAVVAIAGQRRELHLSQRIAGNFTAVAVNEVKIPRNAARQYLTTGTINGRRALVVVDTGANTVALSSSQARSLGIEFLNSGVPVRANTAGGVKNAYAVTLERVEVGGIAIDRVPATVIEGDAPEHILLGTTFLRHVGMREEDGIMYLRQKY